MQQINKKKLKGETVRNEKEEKVEVNKNLNSMRTEEFPGSEIIIQPSTPRERNLRILLILVSLVL